MAMHFPAKAGLIFLTDELSNDRYLVGTGATLSIVPCNQKFKPIWSPSQRGRWANHPLLGFYLKNGAISRQTFYINLSASHCGWSHPGH
jgi:hypothetical protein